MLVKSLLVRSLGTRISQLCLIVVAVHCHGMSLQAQGGSADEVADLTFDDIKFEMEIDSPFDRQYLTERINELNNKQIRIRGYILPSYQQSGITKFILVRDNQECCFGPGAALCDCIYVRLREGETVDFTVRPITVEGKFYLKERKTGGRVMAIFNMKNSKVQ